MVRPDAEGGVETRSLTPGVHARLLLNLQRLRRKW
jgi:hypothetical protein